jgi:hypothetical protein
LLYGLGALRALSDALTRRGASVTCPGTWVNRASLFAPISL